MPAHASEKDSRFFRLDPAVQAETIDLAFDLDPAADTFSGEARYRLHLGKKKRRLILHSADLRISHVRLRIGDDSFRGEVHARPQSETIALDFGRLLPQGDAELRLVFRGDVRADLRGLYRGGNEGEGAQGHGPDGRYLASQLCPTDARRLFPCFDEPGFKARYRIRASVPAELTVLSNAPIASEQTIRKGFREVQFETTPPLSSYLVAIAAGPFEASPVRQAGTTDLCVYTLPGRGGLAGFALETAEQSLLRLERWFGMPHPYPKLDLVAIPDFAFGAMENAGAVFFRDSVLLLDPKEASLDEQKRAAEVIAHELSHMWFGNLVTMAWWNDLWLNEAFATWMAYVIVDDWQPEWSIWLDFAHRREEALEADAFRSTHAIAPKIRSAEEAHENFDAITYTKGASVLRMLEGYLGPKKFQAGVRRYIKTHREGNAEAADLWHALSKASGEPVGKLIDPWTTQKGFPLVSIKRSGRTLRLEQERFHGSRSKAANATRWPILWTARRLRGRRGPSAPFRHRWTAKSTRLPEFELDPFYGNADEAGFFRTAYAGDLEVALSSQLDRLRPAERIGHFGNQWALVVCGRLDVSVLLAAIAKRADDPEPEVLAEIEKLLGRAAARIAPASSPDRARRFRVWIARHFERSFAEAESREANESAATADRRQARLLSILGRLARHEPVQRRCEIQAEDFFARGTQLPGEVAGEILRIAAQRGDSALHRQLLAGARRARTPQARRRMLFALAAFEDPKLARASFDAALDPASAPISDRAQLIQLLLSNPDSAPSAWLGLQTRWGRIEAQMPPILLARLARTTAVALPAEEWPSIRSFFETHPLAAGGRTLREIQEELSRARQLLKTAGPALDRFLAAESLQGPST